MEECEELCDRMLFIRKGKSVGCMPVGNWLRSSKNFCNIRLTLKSGSDLDSFQESLKMLMPTAVLNVILKLTFQIWSNF